MKNLSSQVIPNLDFQNSGKQKQPTLNSASSFHLAVRIVNGV